MTVPGRPHRRRRSLPWDAPSDLDPVVSTASSVSRVPAEPPVRHLRSSSELPSEPRRFALLDVLEPFPLASPVAAVRQLVDRVANVRVGEDDLMFTGIWCRRIPWDSVTSIELSNRFDELLTAGLGFTPLRRAPRLHRRAESAILSAAERVAPLTLSRARERAGWSVVRIHQRARSLELRRLPALVAHLYPAATRSIVAVAERRGIEVVRDPEV